MRKIFYMFDTDAIYFFQIFLIWSWLTPQGSEPVDLVSYYSGSLHLKMLKLRTEGVRNLVTYIANGEAGLDSREFDS